MANTINIAELKIDNTKLLSSLTATKQSIDELTESQKLLKKAGDTSSETFVQNEAKLKALKSEYNSQSKVLQATEKATTSLNSALDKEIRTLDEAKENNKELRAIRNQLNSDTLEGAKAIQTLNAKVDENTNFIEENVDAFENQKMQVGDYKTQITEALGQLNPFNNSMGSFAERSKEAGGTSKLFTSSLKGMTTGMLGMTKASLSFIATPIGAVLAVLVGAFLLVKNAMNRSEDSTNKIKKAFSAFSGITNKLLKILQPLGEFLIDGLVKGFELVEKGVYKSLDAIATGLELLNFDEQAKELRNFNKEIQEGAKDSKALADAEALLQKRQRESGKIQLDYQRQAEKLRQLRDDESKSIAERTKANANLGVLLKKQSAEELKIANLALGVTNLRIKAEGDTTEALDARAEAQEKIAEINERITSQESEQLSNLNSLRKESAEKRSEIADKAIQKQQEQLDLFIAEQGIRAKTLNEQLEIERNVAKQSIEILDSQLANKKISQEKYDTEVLNIKNNLLQKQAELTVQNAQIELEAFIKNNQSKLNSDKYFSDEALRIEKERLDSITQKRRDFAKLQLEEGTINQTEYNEAINTINEENRIANEEAELERKEAKLEADAIDFENQLAIDAEHAEIKLANQLEVLNRQKQQELNSAEKTGADKSKIEKKYANLEENIRKQVADNKLSLASNTLGNLVTIMGRESDAGKAVAVAQATIDTYASAVSAFNAMSGIPIVGPALGGVAAAAAVASGIATVSKIVSTKKPKLARGGILNGASHAQGGIDTPYGELEGGEAVINKRSTAMYAPILSQINEAGGGVKFAKGGILGANKTVPKGMIDYDTLALKVAQANQSLPSPIVSVSEINTVTNSVNAIEQIATF